MVEEEKQDYGSNWKEKNKEGSNRQEASQNRPQQPAKQPGSTPQGREPVGRKGGMGSQSGSPETADESE